MDDIFFGGEKNGDVIRNIFFFAKEMINSEGKGEKHLERKICFLWKRRITEKKAGSLARGWSI